MVLPGVSNAAASGCQLPHRIPKVLLELLLLANLFEKHFLAHMINVNDAGQRQIAVAGVVGGGHRRLGHQAGAEHAFLGQFLAKLGHGLGRALVLILFVLQHLLDHLLLGQWAEIWVAALGLADWDLNLLDVLIRVLLRANALDVVVAGRPPPFHNDPFPGRRRRLMMLMHLMLLLLL